MARGSGRVLKKARVPELLACGGDWSRVARDGTPDARGPLERGAVAAESRAYSPNSWISGP
jgi:hypothetical protein